VVTLRSSIRTFRLKLWDTDSESLVGFPARGARVLPESPANRETLAA
jgi:hypothetical protein